MPIAHDAAKRRLSLVPPSGRGQRRQAAVKMLTGVSEWNRQHIHELMSSDKYNVSRASSVWQPWVVFDLH